MAIASNITSGPYTGNGVQTAFPFTFTVLSASDIYIKIDNAVISSSLYNVSLNSDGTGTATFLAAPSNGASILLVSQPDFTQETTFETEGAYRLDQVNTINRRDVVRANWLSRVLAVLAPSGWEASTSRAGKFLAWDAGGNPYASAGNGSDAGLRTDLASSASGAAIVAYSQAVTYAPGSVGYEIAALKFSGRLKSYAPITVYVDQVNGTDAIGKGTGFGTAAFKTIQYAYGRLCQDYDHNSYVPTIQCAGPTTAGGSRAQQTHTAGLIVSDIDLPLLQNGFDLVGAQQVNLDCGGSIIKPTTGGRCVSVRGTRLYVLLSNVVLDATASAGDSLYVYGGGAEIGIGSGVVWAGTQTGWAMMQASRGGRIHTRPNVTGLSITGSAGYFAQALMQGRIELEGVAINVGSSLSFSQAFLAADDLASISLFQMCWTGANVTGKQFVATKLGMVNQNAQVGGQTLTINGSNVTSVNYTAVPGNSFLPGSIAGEIGFLGGRCSDPGTPRITAGGGTGGIVQNTEPGFQVICGTGNPATVTVTMSTRAAWTGIVPICRNPAAISGLTYGWVGPTSTAPGYLTISWTVVTSSNGLTFDIVCTA